MRTALLLHVALAACKKDAPRDPLEPPSTAEADALWKLAPTGARGGVVASPRALEMAEHAVESIRGVLALPELAGARQRFDELLQEGLGTTTLTLAEYGLSRDRGAALFVTRDGMIAIVPVADRDKFVARAGGKRAGDIDQIDEVTCKQVRGVYACATAEALFGALGQGDLASKLPAVGSRGDIELVGTELPLGDANPGSVAAVVQLARGVVVARGTALGVAEPLLKRFAATAAPRADTQRSSGFAVVHPAPFADSAPALPIGDTTLAAVAKTLQGPLTIAIPAGESVLDGRQALTDPAPMKSLLENCPLLAGFAGASATVADGVCHLAVLQGGLDLELWVEGTTFRIGKRAAIPAGHEVPMTAIGRELASHAWGMAFWGRGTMYATPPAPTAQPGVLSDEAQLFLRAIAALNEVGAGARVEGKAVKFVIALRTAFANPDDVLTKLAAIDPAGLSDGRAAAAGKLVAASSPQSPFAADFAAGQLGLVIPTSLVGMAAAIALPAFFDSRKKGRRSEAAVMLEMMGKSAKISYSTNGRFPVGDTGLIPAVTCCEENYKDKHRCGPNPAFAKPPWTTLDFVLDRPHDFQYSYKSDGKSFTATAVGDLDCDGQIITYELRGEVISGAPSVTLIEPPPGSD